MSVFSGNLAINGTKTKEIRVTTDPNVWRTVTGYVVVTVTQDRPAGASFQVVSGSLPPNVFVEAVKGVIYGNMVQPATDQTYMATIRATDPNNPSNFTDEDYTFFLQGIN
jgi:hypothetical protein